MGEELLDKWVEKAKSLGLSNDFIASMKTEWQSRLSEIETEMHPELDANIASGIMPIDEDDDLDARQKQRMDDAIEMGLDLSKIEEMNAAERRQYGEKKRQ